MLEIINLIFAFTGILTGALLAFGFQLIIQKKKTSIEMLKYYNSPDLVFSRIVVWKFKDKLLEEGGLEAVYDKASAEELLTNPNHILFHLERVNYFWYMLEVEGYDKKYLKKYFDRHYETWYSKFYVKFDKSALEKSDETGWHKSAMERKRLAITLGLND